MPERSWTAWRTRRTADKDGQGDGRDRGTEQGQGDGVIVPFRSTLLLLYNFPSNYCIDKTPSDLLYLKEIAWRFCLLYQYHFV